MANPPTIERAGERGKFSPDELRAKVRESRQFWNSPEGRAAAAQQEREKRHRQLPPTKFPKLAARGTRPTVTGPQTANPREALKRLNDKISKF